jgi:hypothetical protein
MKHGSTRGWQRIAAAAVLAVALTACGASNPVLGEWEVDKEKSDVLAAAGTAVSQAFGAARQVEFQSDKMISGGKTQTVEYDVQEGRVIVTAADGSGTVYTVLDEDHLSTKTAGGTIVLRRVGSTPAVASGPGGEAEPEGEGTEGR